MDIINRLEKILFKINNFRNQINTFYKQNIFFVEKENLIFFIKRIEEIIKDLSDIKKEYYDTFIRSAKLDKMEEIMRNVVNLKREINKCLYYNQTLDPKKIIISEQNYQSILNAANEASTMIKDLILYFRSNPHMITEKDVQKQVQQLKKGNIRETQKLEKNNIGETKEFSKREEEKYAFFKSFKDKIKKKTEAMEQNIKEKISKEKKNIFSVISKISLGIVLIFSFYLVFVFGMILVAIILTVFFYIIYAIFNKKSFGSILVHLFSIAIVYAVVYVIFNTEFSRVICVYTGTCPREVVHKSEKEVAKIKESIFETINKIKKIMENPELYFIESRAEAQATKESYYYMFGIESVNYVPPNYVFFSENEKNMDVFPVTLFYTVRYSLPLNREFNMKFDSYCLIIPNFDLKCLTESSKSNFGVSRALDNLEVFFDEKEHVFKDIEVSKYGLQNFRCLIPKFTIDLENCTDISSHPFYISNRFLVLLSNVTTKTVYKFLVADESLLTKAILERGDLYFYLGLNRDDYDTGYFEGFLDFPKINVIRLGVLSEYPVIKFKDMDSVNDVIYISLPNIENLFDIQNLEIEIIYNSKQLDISLDDKFSGIQTSIYNLSCEKFTDKIKCKVEFSKSYDDFNRNRYIIAYREHADRFFFFIPINIRFSKNFLEYSEVIIQARAVYGIENYIDNEIKYIPIKLQKI